jgi:pilus assembly protein CpaF
MANSFSIDELIYKIRSQQKNKETITTGKTGKTTMDYTQVLGQIQQIISTRHAQELSETLYKENSETHLKGLIMRYLNQYNLATEDKATIFALVGRIYDDMAGFGILTQYLKDPDVEEININGFSGILVQYKNKVEIISQAMPDAQACATIVKKMSRFGGVTLDGSRPIGDSYLSKGVRMSGAIAPCVDDELGAIASVRKQQKAQINRENLIAWETATEAELDFLEMCVTYGVSVALTGATSSGKTSDIGYLLSRVPSDKRIVTIEDTRELDLIKYDSQSLMINDVVHLLTKEPPNAVTMQDLLKLSLRLHPHILVPAEMRGGEALTAQEAGRTGHTVITTLHANSAITAYDRILTMCQMANTSLSEERLLKNIVEAFPIMVNKKRLPDGTRKYVEIFEATGVEDGKVEGQMIFRFIIQHYNRDDQGKIISVKGSHKKVGNVSPALATRLFVEGAPLETIRRFADSDFVPFEDLVGGDDLNEFRDGSFN